MKKRTLFLLGTAGVALFLYAHEGHRGTAVKGIKLEKGRLSMQEANKKAIGLTHARVDFRTIEQTLSISAETGLPSSARAFAGTRIAGVISKILAQPGKPVKKGETLAHLESAEYEALKIEVQQRQADARVAEENLKRAQQAGPGVVSGLELLQLEAAVEEQQNALKALRTQLSAVSLEITAPIDGWLLHVDLAVGQWVEPHDHLFEVLDLSALWLVGEVPETLYARIRAGLQTRASLVAFPGETFAGTILRVGRSVDPQHHTLPVWISIPHGSGRIRPGMFGRVDIVVDRAEDVFAAPSKAIVTDGAERYAIVQNKDGTYRKANVILGRSDAQYVEVVEGLYPGDRIVLEGAHELSDVFVQGTFGLSREARQYIEPRMADVKLRVIDEIVEFPARLRLPPANVASASPRLEGKIGKILVTVGQSVKEGDPVAEIHSLELERLGVDWIRSSLRAKLLQRQLDALRELERKNVAPRKELSRVEAEALTQSNALSALRGKLLQMGLSASQIQRIEDEGNVIGTIQVRAPIAGEINDIPAAVGQFVKPGDPLVDIQNRSRIWAEAYAFERDAAAIPQRRVRVRWLDRDLSANVVGTGAALGDQRVLSVWAELETPEGLPGMSAQVIATVRPGRDEVIAVPRSALLQDGGKTYVFVERRDKFSRVPVVTGRSDAQFVEVVSGLFPGDSVATHGLEELNNAYSAVR